MNQIARVSITMDDDSTAIMSFLTHGRGNILPKGATWSDTPGWWDRDPTDENIFHEMSRSFAGTEAQPVRYRIVKDSDIPADRTYRGALVDDGKALYHDLPKARDIHLARLRRQRTPLLEELDREWMRATGQGKREEVSQIEAKRQALRDMPVTLAPALAAAKTTEQLKTVALGD